MVADVAANIVWKNNAPYSESLTMCGAKPVVPSHPLSFSPNIRP